MLSVEAETVEGVPDGEFKVWVTTGRLRASVDGRTVDVAEYNAECKRRGYEAYFPPDFDERRLIRPGQRYIASVNGEMTLRDA